jgi:anti-sigma regulatory factor (Ser/Thr protein kinase)
MDHDSLRLPADDDCGPVFRQYVRLACLQCHCDGLVDPVLQVADELVSNAIRHAVNDGERFVEVALVPTQRGVRVEVRDGDPTPPHVREPSVDDAEGRGLRVVQSLGTAWGWEPGKVGKTVWVDVDSV